MAVSIVVGTAFTIVKTVAVHSTTLDVGGTAPVAVGCVTNAPGDVQSVGSWSFGGNALTHVLYADSAGHSAEIAHSLAPTALTGVVNVEFNRTSTAGYEYVAVPYAIYAPGPVTVLDTASDTGVTGTNGLVMDSGSEEGFGIMSGEGNSPSALSGNTVAVNDVFTSFAHENALASGSRAVGMNLAGVFAAAGVMYSDGQLIARPDPVNIPVTLTSPAISGPANFVAYPDPIVIPMTVNDLPGVRAEWPRVLPLVGEEAEMSGRVPAPTGLTSPVLTHVGARPVWAAVDSLVTAATRMVPLTTTGAAGDPELVWDDNDELVMTEYNE